MDIPDRNWTPSCGCKSKQQLEKVTAMLEQIIEKADQIQVELNGELEDIEAKKDEISKRANMALMELRAAVCNIQHELSKETEHAKT